MAENVPLASLFVIEASVHHIAGQYLLRYAHEASWREDNRRQSNGEQVERLAGPVMKQNPSVDFSGYWQRRATH